MSDHAFYAELRTTVRAAWLANRAERPRGGRHAVYGPETVEKVVSMRRGGASYMQIGKALGMWDTTVRDICRREMGG